MDGLGASFQHAAFQHICVLLHSIGSVDWWPSTKKGEGKGDLLSTYFFTARHIPFYLLFLHLLLHFIFSSHTCFVVEFALFFSQGIPLIVFF
ncbi:hypothetical protein B0T20DRAFT_189325 [Sordaria brevicollis]|uniref:Uncharacterized protein n=1 Tax=Sordaria brevicollis TaxID=83679 RepID=A0AAE0PFJ6_SORBR|nr:hypothetical protein B0T20DRAFT_189325 [Sordaria brevicollis]